VPADGGPGKAKAKVLAPLLARGFVLALDTTTWVAAGPRATLPAARQLAVGYGPGDQLLVTSAPATARWTLGDATTASLDRATGKLTRTQAAAPLPRVVLTLDDGGVLAATTGLTATWAGEPPTTATLTAGGAPITVPESGAAAQASLALAPDGAHVAFATAVDPCAKDAAPSLYVADAKSGALRHVLTARSRFATRWLDATPLAYEDDAGGVRLWDAATGREVLRLADKGGLALGALSAAAEPPCKATAPVVAPGDGGQDGDLPGEEPEPSSDPATPGGPIVNPAP
jgi:hypothetical protein